MTFSQSVGWLSGEKNRIHKEAARGSSSAAQPRGTTFDNHYYNNSPVNTSRGLNKYNPHRLKSPHYIPDEIYPPSVQSVERGWTIHSDRHVFRMIPVTRKQFKVENHWSTGTCSGWNCCGRYQRDRYNKSIESKSHRPRIGLTNLAANLCWWDRSFKMRGPTDTAAWRGPTKKWVLRDSSPEWIWSVTWASSVAFCLNKNDWEPISVPGGLIHFFTSRLPASVSHFTSGN